MEARSDSLDIKKIADFSFLIFKNLTKIVISLMPIVLARVNLNN